MTRQEEALWVAVKALQRRLTTSAGGVPPSTHATNHSDGGSDAIDVTDLDGFPGGTSTFLRADGSFATPSGTGIDQLTGDVTAGPGSGSQAATIANDAVSNAKLANMAEATFKGRAAGAGTGDPTDLSAAQARVIVALTGTVGAWLVTVGDVVFVQCPYAGTITSCVIAGFDTDGASATGDAEADIAKDTEANYPPDGSDSIVASAPPTLSADVLVRDNTLSGWTTSVSAGDWFRFELVSSDVDKVLVQLTLLRS